MVPLATKRSVGLRNVDVTLSSNTVRLMLCSCRINNEDHMKRFEKCNVERERERERGKGRRKMEHSIKRNVCHYVRTFIMQIRT